MKRKSKRLQARNRRPAPPVRAAAAAAAAAAAKADDRPDIEAMFQSFNRLYFGSGLGDCTVRWSSQRSRSAGRCLCGDGTCEIRLSEPILKSRGLHDVKAVLLHEMIHAHLFFTSGVREHGEHGAEFRSKMDEIFNSWHPDEQPEDEYVVRLAQALQACADAEKQPACPLNSGARRGGRRAAFFGRSIPPENPNAATLAMVLTSDQITAWQSTVVTQTADLAATALADQSTDVAQSSTPSVAADQSTEVALSSTPSAAADQSTEVALSSTPSAAAEVTVVPQSAATVPVQRSSFPGTVCPENTACPPDSAAVQDTEVPQIVPRTSTAVPQTRSTVIALPCLRRLNTKPAPGKRDPVKTEPRKRKLQKVGDLKRSKVPRLESGGAAASNVPERGNRSPNVVIAWANYRAYETEDEGEKLINRRFQRRAEEKAKRNPMAPAEKARQNVTSPAAECDKFHKLEVGGSSQEPGALVVWTSEPEVPKCVESYAACDVYDDMSKALVLFDDLMTSAPVIAPQVKCFERRRKSAAAAVVQVPRPAAAALVQVPKQVPKPAAAAAVVQVPKQVPKPVAAAVVPAPKNSQSRPGTSSVHHGKQVARVQCPICSKFLKIDCSNAEGNAEFNTHVDLCLNGACI